MRYKCTTPGCREYKDYPGKCPSCKRRQRRSTDQRRGSAHQRGYGKQHRDARKEVLAQDPLCMCTHHCVDHGFNPCPRRSEVADHYPLSRRELEAAGEDPNQISFMRGLCKPCHDRHTARTNPGGWNDRGGL